MAEKKHYSKGEEADRASQLRAKKERGETLTREEAGFLGALGSRRATAREREKAEASGREKEFEEEHRTKSWMAGEKTRAPEVSEKTEHEVERIHRKQERGETLTRHEAGVLGGAERASEASDRST
jgi:aminoglycoside phosphotransferase